MEVRSDRLLGYATASNIDIARMDRTYMNNWADILRKLLHFWFCKKHDLYSSMMSKEDQAESKGKLRNIYSRYNFCMTHIITFAAYYFFSINLLYKIYYTIKYMINKYT